MKANSPSNPTHIHTHTHHSCKDPRENCTFNFQTPNCIRTALLSSPLSLSLPLCLSLSSLFLSAAQDFQGTITWCSAPLLGSPLPLHLSLYVALSLSLLSAPNFLTLLLPLPLSSLCFLILLSLCLLLFLLLSISQTVPFLFCLFSFLPLNCIPSPFSRSSYSLFPPPILPIWN